MHYSCMIVYCANLFSIKSYVGRSTFLYCMSDKRNTVRNRFGIRLWKQNAYLSKSLKGC